jgi:hypothetical protein
MPKYPKEINMKLRVYEDGKIEILDPPGVALTDALKTGRTIKGHNSIGVLVSNPTCFIVNGQMHCA